jgi:predicted DNA-binding transcriptional regulator YafY
MLGAAPVYRAVAVLQAPVSDVMARLGDSGHSVRAINRRSCRIHLEADTLDWLVQRLVVLGCDFVVEEPDELIEHVRLLGDRLTRAADW